MDLFATDPPDTCHQRDTHRIDRFTGGHNDATLTRITQAPKSHPHKVFSGAVGRTTNMALDVIATWWSDAASGRYSPERGPLRGSSTQR